MKKKKLFSLCLILCLISTLFTACCNHEWVEANCGAPKTCSLCGKTKGSPVGEHSWKDATCTDPKNCSVCGTTEGESLGHTWIAATCTEAKTCSVCDETEGNPLGHTWKDATCTEPKTCETCNITEGEATGHKVDAWEESLKATCTSEGKNEGVCSVCNETIEKTIKQKKHKAGDWEITEKATFNSEGTRQKKCKNCGKVLKEESYELSDSEKESQFKSTCKEYTYEEIARNPDDHFLEHAVYTGEVVQVIEGDDGELQFRISITPTSWGGYTDTIFVELPEFAAKRLKSRILEDDIVTVWGYNFSTISYETVLGAKMTIPAVSAEYMEIVG